MKRILVTGGAGFIGSHLCERLVNDGNDVICVDNFYSGSKENVWHLIGKPNFELVRHDVINPYWAEVDEIYNLACPASPIYYQTPIGLRSCYDEGKRCAETLFFDYHRIHNVRIKVIRIFNTYGPRMAVSDGRVVSNFVVQALRGEDITIYGDGQQTRSFQYVTDLIDGMLRVMATGDDFTGPVNLGNPGEFTMLELAEKVIKKVGGKSKIVFRPLLVTIQRCADQTLLSPRISLVGSQRLRLMRVWIISSPISATISQNTNFAFLHKKRHLLFR